MQKVTPCLWFNGQAEQAASYYVSLLPDSRIDRVVRSPADTPSGPAGMVLAVEFTLAGNKFTDSTAGRSSRSPRRCRSRSPARIRRRWTGSGRR